MDKFIDYKGKTYETRECLWLKGCKYIVINNGIFNYPPDLYSLGTLRVIDQGDAAYILNSLENLTNPLLFDE